ncbi:MAG: hypothetical protein JWM16_1361 [Verrucomicrobiales bacterium]|nr:hypothetical protein [Verrucomicrobiales bacterium]
MHFPLNHTLGQPARAGKDVLRTLAIFLLFGAMGCSKVAVAPAQEDVPAPAQFSLDSYPRMNKMRLAVLTCRVLPRTSMTVNSPLAGQIKLYVDKPQTNLQTGFVWAEFEPKILAAESNALAEAKSRLAERERLIMELDLPKQTFKTAHDIEEARRQLALLEVVATNRDLLGATVNFPGLKDKSINPENVARARQELKVMEDGYRYLQQTNLAVLGVDLQSQRMELQRRSLDYERQQTQSRFKMPFAGQLNISLQMADGIVEYPVYAGQELAVVRDLSTVMVRLALSDASWSALPSESMSAIVNLPDGRRLEAPFTLKRIEKVQNREDVIYYFQFPTESISSAVRLIGTDVSCELWLGLPEPARIVPKLALVMAKPALFQDRRWNIGLSTLARGARVLVEGQTDLAIVTPSAPTKKL